MTTGEIAEATGISQNAVKTSILGARKNYGVMFFVIHEYRRNFGSGPRGHGMTKIYKAGPGRDAVRPDANSPEEVKDRARRYRERNQTMIRARENAKRGSKTARNPFAQLFMVTGATNSVAMRILHEKKS